MDHNKPNRPKQLLKLLPLLVLLGACATGILQEKMLNMPTIEGASYVGEEACADCHEDVTKAFTKNVHGRLADFELGGWQKGCESCHGRGSLHVDGDGDTAKILQPGKLDSAEAEALCVGCHTSGKLMDWTFGEHALSNVTCTDCHSLHGEGTAKANLKKSDPELCYDCHQEQMAKANFPSHHPIKEGKMNCSDCHNPHGELQTDELARDLCLNCHSRYQGPFVFEHAPVEEDCNICHDPHGTIANNLLLQNEPFLCLQCHESHFHAARVGGTSGTTGKFAFDGNELEALKTTDPVAWADITGDDGSGALTPSQAITAYPSYDVTVPFTNDESQDAGWRRGFLTKCTVCHSVVHGTDLPSQTVPVIDANGDGFPDGGSGLTR